MTRIDTAVKRLQKAFPNITGIRPGSELGYGDDCIFLGDCAEGGTIDGYGACYYNAWSDDPNEEIWVLGVHKDLREKLDQLGFFPECHDPGTYLAYRT